MNKNIMAKIFVNILTSIRIIGSCALIPVFYTLGPIITSNLFLLIISTDWIDGFLARKLGVSTFFGALLDGISDKLLGITTLILLVSTIPSLSGAIALEVAILGVGTYKLITGNPVKSSIVGKSKMWVLAIGVFIGLITSDYTSFRELCRSLNLPLISITKVDNIRKSVGLLVVTSEVLTLNSYIDLKKVNNNELEAKKLKLVDLKERLNNLKNNLESQDEVLKKLFDTEFYEQNKDNGNLSLFLKKTD